MASLYWSVQRQRAGDAIVGINADGGQMMQSTVVLSEIALRLDCIPLALLETRR